MGSMLEYFASLLEISLADVLANTNIPADILENEGRGVTTEQYFEGWAAAMSLSKLPDLPLFVGKTFAENPFMPGCYAFRCSPTVLTGLERLAVFKPLVAPLNLSIIPSGDELRLVKSSPVVGLALPAEFAATEMVFFVETIRNCTEVHIHPARVTLPCRLACHDALEDYFGIKITIGGVSEMRLHKADGARPLVSRNPLQWAVMEPELRRQLNVLTAGQSMAARVCETLSGMLPSGLSNITEAASRLHVSTRSLQRRLSSEGQSYQMVLDDMRRSLALHYLRHTNLNTEEVSYLLAYRDPNSFYRAFQGWTGMTPKAARLAS